VSDDVRSRRVIGVNRTSPEETVDGSRFDDLTRALTQARSRRSLLRAAAGAAIAGALSVAGAGSSAAASKRTIGQICRKHGDCANDVCGPKDRRGRQYCCAPEPVETTCATICGPSVNNCGLTVDCNGNNGDSCQTGSECSSGTCENGVCTGLPIYSACSLDCQCDSNICSEYYLSCIICAQAPGQCTRDIECCSGSCNLGEDQSNYPYAGECVPVG
jgi:hypothetical protein